MLFNSWQFAVFLPAVFTIYWLLPHRHRWGLLLISSYWFYMSWNVKYVVLILFTTAATYACALAMERTDDTHRRKRYLVLTLIACLGVLFLFKYFNFATESVAAFISAFVRPVHPLTLRLLLPVGISFYTFQTLGYVIDVYRGEVKAETHFGYYATFISFFPQLVAGPIERTSNLLPQIRAEHRFDADQAIGGAKQMLWGYYKKMAIADNLSPYVDRIFGNVSDYHGFSFFIASFFFVIQIYCDFSGYSDIARGAAKLMGIELMENFKSPFFSTSIRELWSRWHVSLNGWFRDYVYVSLGGSRKGAFRRKINLMLTFLASGLWHGANWTFVLWGGLNGIGEIIESYTGLQRVKPANALTRTVRTLFVFLFFVVTATCFRARSLGDIVHIYTQVFSGIALPARYLWQGFVDVQMTKETLAGCVCLFFLPLALYDFIAYRHDKNGVEVIDGWNRIPRWIFWILIGLVTVFFTPKGVPEDFVYFQF